MPIRNVLVPSSDPDDWGGIWYPRVFCDACGKRIDGPGNVEWDYEQTGGALLAFTHKGRCSDVLRDRFPRVTWACEEVETFTTYLAHNTVGPLRCRSTEAGGKINGKRQDD